MSALSHFLLLKTQLGGLQPLKVVLRALGIFLELACFLFLPSFHPFFLLVTTDYIYNTLKRYFVLLFFNYNRNVWHCLIGSNMDGPRECHTE